MGTYAKTAACALLVVYICAVSSAQSQFSANTTGKSDEVGWAGWDPKSTSAYGVPQVPSKMTKHKKSEQVSPDDVPIVNKSALPRFDIVPFRHDDSKFYYGIRIVTGVQKGIGASDPKIHLELIGTKAMSGPVKVKTGWLGALRRPHRRQVCDDLIVESREDLGDILVVVLGNKNEWFTDHGTPWYVKYVAVYSNNKEVVFPCYHWIGEEHIHFTAHTTTLKDVNTEVLQTQRAIQLQQRKKLYKWLKLPFSPSGINSASSKLPADEQFAKVKNFDFTKNAIEATGFLGLRGVFTTLDSLHSYELLARTMGKPSMPVFEGHRWVSDVEFGRQMLNAVNPVVIEKCSSLPDYFPVTNEMVKSYLTRGLSLEEEMEAGHIYTCDLTLMQNLPCRDGYYSAAPVCLLYVNGNNQLVPIAIQLKKDPGENNPIFLPGDNWIDWLLAKIYYQSAHLQYHQLSTHYHSCHAAMEAYAMGTMRNLPDPHPLYKLLRPHFQYTMAINARARETLIAPNTIIDQIFSIGGEGKDELMSMDYATYNVQRTNIKRNIKERGVDNPEQLPNYYYRDDGLKIWDAIECYARDIITYFYGSDDDVKNDKELQNWAKDLYFNGFPTSSYYCEDFDDDDFDDCDENTRTSGHGFPKHIKTREELVEYCTLIMFTGSAQHAAVNFGQYDYYGYTPNAPVGLRKPPPTKKGEADYQTLLDTLPDKQTTVRAIAVSHLLSQFSRDEVYLGDYPERFTENEAKKSIKKFQEELQKISDDIAERNKKMDIPYTYLMPENIPNSIAI